MVSLPRFLAPGDNARIGVVVNNLEGEPGDYRLTLSATGAGAFATPIDRPITLATADRISPTAFTLSAKTTGNIALNLELTGPGGLRIARDFTVGVRPAQSYQLRRFVGRLEPGQSVTLDDNAADAFLPGTAEAFLTVSPRPDWDVPGLLRALDRYAYGCLEQTTSRALPLLYVDAVAGLWRTDPGFSPAETRRSRDRPCRRIAARRRQFRRVERHRRHRAVARRLRHRFSDPRQGARQECAGFRDQGRARLAARLCPAGAYEIEELPAVAYAHYVLARGRAGDVPTLRYFNDTQLAKLPTQLAMAQLGAALAQAGDVARAERGLRRRARSAAAAAGRAALCRLRQRAARQRRRARLCRRQSGQNSRV